ncbi:hypothetical protein N658DRAFT_107545 [Parathielavia hyrcaniae]|uniref:Uncharacterized protein n=1 Tax=Parathielavia hyrcaniae TaxID=113614 RepID=A0AAN6Q0Z8_9PEZI|nr:hypothetical protein N658DRAFT_107545 [Parathielavia hyrcaniae]
MQLLCLGVPVVGRCPAARWPEPNADGAAKSCNGDRSTSLGTSRLRIAPGGCAPQRDIFPSAGVAPQSRSRYGYSSAVVETCHQQAAWCGDSCGSLWGPEPEELPQSLGLLDNFESKKKNTPHRRDSESWEECGTLVKHSLFFAGYSRSISYGRGTSDLPRPARTARVLDSWAHLLGRTLRKVFGLGRFSHLADPRFGPLLKITPRLACAGEPAAAPAITWERSKYQVDDSCCGMAKEGNGSHPSPFAFTREIGEISDVLPQQCDPGPERRILLRYPRQSKGPSIPGFGNATLPNARQQSIRPLLDRE